MEPHFSNLLLNMQATYCYIGDLPLIVEKDTVSKVFARNLARAMKAANNGRGISQKALASSTGVGQTTISLYMRPEARNPSDRAAPSPTIERVAKLAKALGTEPWLLVHPHPEQAQFAVALLGQVRQEAYSQPALRFPPAPKSSGVLAVHQPYIPYDAKPEKARRRKK